MAFVGLCGFSSPRTIYIGAAYFDRLLNWWATESDQIALTYLTSALTLLAERRNAEAIWNVAKSRPPGPLHYHLLTKLTAFHSVGEDAKKAILDYLYSDSLMPGDLDVISSIDDGRIQRWFEESAPNSHASRIRTNAARVVQRRKRRGGIPYAKSGPEVHKEIFSTEVDAAKFASTIDTIAEKIGIPVSDLHMFAQSIRDADWTGGPTLLFGVMAA